MLATVISMTWTIVCSVGVVDGSSEVGPLVRALQVVHRYGTSEAVTPSSDSTVKGALAKGLRSDAALSARELDGILDGATVRALAGSGTTLDIETLERIATMSVPESRTHLLPEVRAHAEFLTTSFDMIDVLHREAGAELVDWIVANHQPGEPLAVTVICTGNSRRSMMGSTFGNIAAAYYGLPEIRFYSGGTTPSAFNRRSIAALRAIGVEIAPTDEQAERGDPETPNPKYRVRWGLDPVDDETYAATEFSKSYGDSANPSSGFAAILVCGEADEACPLVRGATARIPMPYLDPKIYDDSIYEAAKYAERRDDIGRLMLAVLMQVRNRLETDTLFEAEPGS